MHVTITIQILLLLSIHPFSSGSEALMCEGLWFRRWLEVARQTKISPQRSQRTQRKPGTTPKAAPGSEKRGHSSSHCLLCGLCDLCGDVFCLRRLNHSWRSSPPCDGLAGPASAIGAMPQPPARAQGLPASMGAIRHGETDAGMVKWVDPAGCPGPTLPRVRARFIITLLS